MGDLKTSLDCDVLAEHLSLVEHLTLEFDIDFLGDLLCKVKKSIYMVNQKFTHQVSVRLRKAELSGV